MTAKRLPLAVGGVALYILAVGSLMVRAPLWNDELYTWYFAQLPTVGDVWDALSTGTEQLPPFYYLVTRGSLALFGDSDIGLRIPSALGFLLACGSLFAVVARRTNAWYGLVAALVPLASGAAPYAWEARPYALVVGFAAAAVLCHQLRTDDVYPRLVVVGLAAALAAAAAVHYYGALVVVPLLVAEAVRTRVRGRVDRAVVLALVAPVVPLAVSIPLIRGARRYAGAFWTDFDLGSAPEFYVFLLRAEVFSPSRIPIWLGIAFAAIVLGAALVVLLRRPRRWGIEVASAVGFLVLPLLGVLVGELVTGAYVERYVLAAVIGPALLIPLSLHRASGGRTSAAVVAAFVLVAWFVVLFQYWHRDIGVDVDRRNRLVAFLETNTPADGSDVAVAHPHDYLELAHGAPEPIATRLIRISDPERSLRITGSRSTEDGLVILSDFAPLRIVSYDRALKAHFVLLRTIRGDARDWIDPALAEDRAHVEVIADDRRDGFTLVRVEPAAQ